VLTERLPILVADDDDPTQKLVQALLRRHGYGTVAASNGHDAIELLRSRRFAAVVLDVMMPRVGGQQVVEFLSTQPNPTPVIICTAAPPKASANFDPLVVKAVLRKPFDIDDFVATVTGVAGAIPANARVLIVDDDMRDRYVLRTFLEPTESHEVDSGEAALESIRESRPDVVLLDLILPGLQGEELLRVLRQHAETTSVPVVVVTNKLLSDEEREELLAYAAGVVYKGDLSRDTLRRAIRDAVR